MKNSTNFVPGLEGVVAAETRLSHVDGLAGELVIGGFPLAELAANATFEETVYLLWYGRLPTAVELTTFQPKLAAYRTIPPATLALLQSVAAENAPAMDALRIGAGTLSLGVPNEQLALAIVARFPTIVAAYWRFLQGQSPIAPRADLSHAANYLYMLTGEEPSAARVRGLETYLNTVVDHGLNASTFAARVIIATNSDLVSAVTGAVGALKGPLHGGAPGPALDTVFEIGTPERAELVLRAKLDAGERLMGFGHRIYKVRDPRAEVLAAAAEQMFAADGDLALYELAKEVEATAVTLLAEYKAGRNLQTNVEFYTALLLHGLGLETDLFTPTFAISRAAGWIAHCLEQQRYGRLIRPQSAYIGEKGLAWQPISMRG
ncbi:MAG: citrate synthase/methylcitrate synthase [Chloroflexi bacterium]|nr:citrate synthase/methylcitrate synthase [Ardenticatenaceae bacterium]MBL1128339.1 citrate synthase/methylcitrate synthase [Chloroflexota bacterium]NOG34414.1 citrate synthase/methylcitrate synthase [Chloroflexota bacterium]GIK57699.1 MAG: citrate synthase 1 [Chloroflexota bacterium]